MNDARCSTRSNSMGFRENCKCVCSGGRDEWLVMQFHEVQQAEFPRASAHRNHQTPAANHRREACGMLIWKMQRLRNQNIRRRLSAIQLQATCHKKHKAQARGGLPKPNVQRQCAHDAKCQVPPRKDHTVHLAHSTHTHKHKDKYKMQMDNGQWQWTMHKIVNLKR